MSRRNIDEDFIDISSEEEKNARKQKEKTKFEENGVTYDPYAISKEHKLPVWFKATLIKWWVAGMVFYFLFFGFRTIIAGFAFALVLGLAWGIITDVFVNHAFRNFTVDGKDYERYILFGRSRGLWTIPLNLLYGVALSYACYELMSTFLLLLKSADPNLDADNFQFYVWPLAYAFLMLGLDLLAVGIRNLIEKKIRNNKKSNEKDDK